MSIPFVKGIIALILFYCLSPFTLAQKKIAVEDFTTRNIFTPKSVNNINWMKDGKFYSALENNKIVRYNVTTGQAEQTIVDGASLPGKIEIQEYSFSSDEKQVLLTTQKKSVYRRSYLAEYYVYNVQGKDLQKLSAGGKQSYAQFSPDGTKVAFVRSNNLFYVNLADMVEVQITDDGKFNHIINGTTDWVYEEEFGFVIGFFWSPDSRKIAYYRFDESKVKEYNMQVWGSSAYPTDYRFKYPKAGEANSEVEIWIVELSSGKKIKSELGDEKDMYIPRVTWTASAETLSVRKLNRLQNEAELIHISSTTGQAKTVLREKSETYVDIEATDDLVYLSNGKEFVATSEASGFKHIALYSADGKLINQITKGDFEVVNFLGLDEKSKLVYYTSTESSPLERNLYSISLDGKRKNRLTSEKGYHSINLSPDYQFYIDHYSGANTPTVVSLYQTKGNKLVKVLERNENLRNKVDEFRIAKKEFFSFPAANGVSLNGYFLKPEGFVEGKKYPVLLYQYSGPGSQNASDIWAGNHFYFHQLLAQQGYVVAVVDTRGTGGRGEQFKKLTYKQLGKYELEDLIATGKYFSTLSFIDAERMGIWGWSYGGYMSALAMTKGAGLFKVGIAVSPVSNWRLYDTIYTERFLQTPDLNPSGYDDNSPLTHAAKLQGAFLLIHGTGDDNVHFQNSVLLQDALIKAGKQFESFYYPDKHHGIQGADTRFHLYSMMRDFILEKL